MDDKTLKVLEFNKILNLISEFSVISKTKEKIIEIKPLYNMNDINTLLKETSEAVNMVVKNGSPPLSPISDSSGIIRRVEINAVLSCSELIEIRHLLNVSKRLKKYSSNEKARYSDGKEINYPTLDLYFNRITILDKLERKIDMCILSEEEVSDDASIDLAKIRKRIKSENNKVKDLLNSIIHSPNYKKYLQEPIVTVRGDRYVIPVKSECRVNIKGIVHDSSSTGSTLFIEPMSVVEANNIIRQLKAEEQNEIEKILSEISSEVKNHVEELKENLNKIVEIDIVFSKAKFSLNYDCKEPVLNDNGYTCIKKGRHPLIDKKEVVPIDIFFGREFNTLVITGPNTGGKTVTLKTIGLLTLMVQAGIHIPVGLESEIGIFKNIFADIGDEQSIEQSLSTFSSHMKNIVEILKNADENSLVLLDELGAGTDPTEGAALAMSILEYFHQIGAKTAATTHYSELKIFALTKDGIENAACEFNVDTLRPTYKLLIGIPGKSNAFAIAERLSLDVNIIDRAKELISKESVRFEDIISDLEKNKQQAEKEMTLAKIHSKEAEELKMLLEEKKEKFDNQKDKILNDARREAKMIIETAKQDADEIVKNIRRLQEEGFKNISNKELEEEKKKLTDKIKDIDKAITDSIIPKNNNKKAPKNIRIGDHVEITTLGQNGTILSKPDENGEVAVQVGIMKIKVHKSNLRTKKVKEDTTLMTKSGVGRISQEKSSNISNEIDVRGMVLEEAYIVIDKFLDDAVLTKLEKIMIIHGKGTGALRSGIHQMLKKHKFVKSFRSGRFGEGEDGVTVVELK